MDNNKRENNLPDDEFDIEMLAQKIWNINKKAFNKVLWPFRLIFINTKRLYYCVTIAVIVSVVLRFTLPNIYESDFIIKPQRESGNVSINMLNDLNQMVKDDNYEDIGRLIGLNKDLCENLIRIKTYPIYKNAFRNDSVDLIVISLMLKNARLVDTFQYAIMNNYLEQNPYFKKKISVRLNELDIIEKQLLNDLQENDSLKKILTSSVIPRGSGGFVYGEPINPQQVYVTGYQLHERLLNIRSEKEFTQSFEMAKPGIVRLKPFFPRMIILLPVCLFVSLSVCLYMGHKQYKNQQSL